MEGPSNKVASSGKAQTKPKTTTTTAKKPVRRNLEARREQNRVASRNYREKRRQKLALLNDLLEPEPPAQGDTSQAPQVAAVGPANGGAMQWQPQGMEAFDFSVFPTPLDMSTGDVIPFDAYDAISDPQSLDSGSSSSGLSPESMLAPGDPVALQSSTWTSSDPTLLTSAPMLSWQESDPRVGIDPLALQKSTSTARATPREADALRHVTGGIKALTLSQKRDLIRDLQWEVRMEEEEKYDPKDPVNMAKRRTLDSARVKALRYITMEATPAQTPSSFIAQVGFFSAYSANCYALGMQGYSALLRESSASIFSLDQDNGYHVSQLSVMRPKFKGLSPDLRPSDTQLTIGHHPYLDIIPFGTFRDNVLMATAQDPPLLDEDLLCHDLLTGGFIFWGGVGNKRGMEASVPWDSRSWEPSVWFLRKYHRFTGGWDGELWMSSRQWHMDRMEKPPKPPSKSGFVDEAVTESDWSTVPTEMPWCPGVEL